MRRFAPFLALLAAAAAAQAPAPTTIPYQGVLTDAVGQPLADGSYTIALRLFEAVTGGTAAYAEDHTVATVDGWFAVALGAGSATTGTWSSLPFDQAWWVETAVDGTTLSPRTPLGASPYARGLSVPANISGDAPDGAAVFITNEATSGGFGNGLTVTGAGVGTSRAVNAQTAAPSGTGVYGLASSAINRTNGVHGVANSTAGYGVYGVASAAGGFTGGVVGEAASPDGSGVVGRSTATSGPAKGVYGESDSPDGAGVWGVNLATTGDAHGVYAETSAPTGLAFYGHNLATTGYAHGGYARTESTQGTAFVGRAAATTGTTNGVLGESNSTSGRGVYGMVTAATGPTVGVFGQSASTSGRGVYGWASSATDRTNGVQGVANSTAGYGVYGVASAAGGFTGGVVGEAASPDGSGVVGRSTATTGDAKGVYGETSSPTGTGVWGASLSTTGTTARFGVRGENAGPAGAGVYGRATAATGLANGVQGDADSPTGLAGLFTKAHGGTDTDPQAHVARIWNTDNSTGNGDVLALSVNSSDPTGASNFVTFFGGGGLQAVGAIEGNGAGGVLYKTTGADFAEWLPYAPAAAPAVPGDVVGVWAGHVSLATDGAEQVLVVSSRPALVGNAGEGTEAGGVVVALVGQAEVRVDGPVASGDVLVASGRADGRARAVAPGAYDPAADGPPIGRAMGPTAGGTVSALVGVDEAAALRAVVARQQDQIDALARRLEALLDRLGLDDASSAAAALR